MSLISLPNILHFLEDKNTKPKYNYILRLDVTTGKIEAVKCDFLTNMVTSLAHRNSIKYDLKDICTHLNTNFEKFLYTLDRQNMTRFENALLRRVKEYGTGENTQVLKIAIEAFEKINPKATA